MTGATLRNFLSIRLNVRTNTKGIKRKKKAVFFVLRFGKKVITTAVLKMSFIYSKKIILTKFFNTFAKFLSNVFI